MSTTQFEGRARFARSLRRPIADYTKRSFGQEELASIPQFVSPKEMGLLLNTDGVSGKHGSGTSRVHGLTVTTFSVEFENAKSQWRQTAGSKQWEFTGGKIFLVVEMEIYVLDWYKKRPDLVKKIMDHELLHVKDEIEIATKFMPSRMPKQDMFKKYLIDRTPVDDAMYRNFFLTDKLGDYVVDVWATEHNSKGSFRDSGKAYAEYGNDIVRMLQNQ
jgi:hypothetical protein